MNLYFGWGRSIRGVHVPVIALCLLGSGPIPACAETTADGGGRETADGRAPLLSEGGVTRWALFGAMYSPDRRSGWAGAADLAAYGHTRAVVAPTQWNLLENGQAHPSPDVVLANLAASRAAGVEPCVDVPGGYISSEHLRRANLTWADLPSDVLLRRPSGEPLVGGWGERWINVTSATAIDWVSAHIWAPTRAGYPTVCAYFDGMNVGGAGPSLAAGYRSETTILIDADLDGRADDVASFFSRYRTGIRALAVAARSRFAAVQLIANDAARDDEPAGVRASVDGALFEYATWALTRRTDPTWDVARSLVEPVGIWRAAGKLPILAFGVPTARRARVCDTGCVAGYACSTAFPPACDDFASEMAASNTEDAQYWTAAVLIAYALDASYVLDFGTAGAAPEHFGEARVAQPLVYALGPLNAPAWLDHGILVAYRRGGAIFVNLRRDDTPFVWTPDPTCSRPVYVGPELRVVTHDSPLVIAPGTGVELGGCLEAGGDPSPASPASTPPTAPTCEPHPVTCGVGMCSRMTSSCDAAGCAPGSPVVETCNGADDDCDGAIDEDGVCAAPCVPRAVTCGVGACARTTSSCDAAGCLPGSPVVETCNGADDDCDGATDEDSVCAPAAPTTRVVRIRIGAASVTATGWGGSSAPAGTPGPGTWFCPGWLAFAPPAGTDSGAPCTTWGESTPTGLEISFRVPAGARRLVLNGLTPASAWLCSPLGFGASIVVLEGASTVTCDTSVDGSHPNVSIAW